jgi:hypothetical protein
MKDEVTVTQRKQPGTHKKGHGLHAWQRMTDGKRSIAEMSWIARTFFGMCPITGCDQALFGAMRGAFVPSVRVNQRIQTVCFCVVFLPLSSIQTLFFLT